MRRRRRKRFFTKRRIGKALSLLGQVWLSESEEEEKEYESKSALCFVLGFLIPGLWFVPFKFHIEKEIRRKHLEEIEQQRREEKEYQELINESNRRIRELTYKEQEVKRQAPILLVELNKLKNEYNNEIKKIKEERSNIKKYIAEQREIIKNIKNSSPEEKIKLTKQKLEIESNKIKISLLDLEISKVEVKITKIETKEYELKHIRKIEELEKYSIDKIKQDIEKE